MDTQRVASLIVDRLDELSEEITKKWNNPEGTKTRHLIIDNFLPNDFATAIYDAFPRNADGFFDKNTFREKKKTLATLDDRPEILSTITYGMQHPSVVNKVASLLGFKDIIPDPTLYAGGLSMMFKDDFLNPHIDNSHDGARNLYRRLNMLYYVSPDWALENGGNFELWDEKVKIQKTITSKFNRLVVMETNKNSWHSVSPVKVELPRCCVSNYYFSKTSPDNHDYFHVTSFNGRPEEVGRRIISTFDNTARNIASKLLRLGRGKKLANTSKKTEK